MAARSALPVVGIPADVWAIGVNPFHAIGEKYINAVAHGAGALPLMIPAFGGGEHLEPLDEHVDLDDLISRLDGLLMTGSPSNVEPRRYGGPPSAPGTLEDLQRDATTLPLIEAAIKRGLPLFAICRGMQELNVALGGTLHQRVHEVPGFMDHRSDKSLPRDARYAPAHEVRFTPEGTLARLARGENARVNSLHTQGIDRLGERLLVEAVDADGLVEAVRVGDAPAFALGVAWHPEWRFEDDPLSRALFDAFGEAIDARAATRSSPTPRQERREP